MAKSKKSLAETHPELAKEWHPTKNESLTPNDMTPGSGKKVWWKCPQGNDHQWEATISSRSNGRGCPICAGKKVVKSNCLSTTHPELAKEWHPTKNENLTPNDVFAGSTQKLWWKCNVASDHVWQTSASKRRKGTGCPMCSGKNVVKSNSLAYVKPQIASEWYYELNKNLTPKDVTPGSGNKVWWKCSKGVDHIWFAPVSSRATRGCPICAGKKVVKSNCLSTTHPELAKEWHPTKNENLTPNSIGSGSHKIYWWKCAKGDEHEWKASVANRTNGTGCPICLNRVIVHSNSLLKNYPDIASQWHPTKNGNLRPSDIGSGSARLVWWQCEQGMDHVWKAGARDRCNGNGCPFCSNQKIILSNSLGTLDPEKAREWHPTKNGAITPFDVGVGSTNKIWWKCDEGDDHEWQVAIVQKRGCPVCSGRKVVLSNCLETKNPELAKEWHLTKNKNITPYDVSEHSGKKVWWRCRVSKDHEWRSTIVNRSRGRGCPYCDLTPQSKQELIITFELKTFFKRIDPRGFKARLDGKLRAIDIFIPKLGLCIEFDGSYWHKDKREIDKIKSNLLLKEGYRVIRVREEPLKKIHDTDVISKQPYDGKQVTNDILSMILSMYDLNPELVQRIKDYQSKGELQNERGLNRYIDKILKEKAEKK